MNYLNGGYAMIKHNSTQEELQIAYRSKKPVLCYDENRRAHWAVIEETATESVDGETQEPITIYEYSYRLIDEVSEVHLYQHSLWLNMENLYYVYCDILSNSETPFTVSKLASFIYNEGDGLRIQATGQIKAHAIATHLESSGRDSFNVSGIDIYNNSFTDTNSISSNITSIIDHVKQLI